MTDKSNISKKYLIARSSFTPFGPARIKLLIRYFGSSRKAWEVSAQKLLEVGLSQKIVKAFENFRKSFDFENYTTSLKRMKVTALSIFDEAYPKNLKQISDAPQVLYVRGKLTKSDENSVAIVGSRKMTSYGREVTEKIAVELANSGITIVSGLAFGVDFAAHKSALSVKGRCIAVLASGVDMITPRSNEWLGLEIIRSGGAIISEFPPGVVAQKHFFPFRNRIISGLSKGVVVVEGMIKSGTIHTATHAADQGRTVFAVPGQITSPMSAAPLFLIKNGAKMLTDVSDIFEDLDLQFVVDRQKVERVLPATTEEEIILRILANEPLHLDEIGRITKLQTSSVSATLTVMEIKGIVKNIGNGVYKKI